MYYGLQHSERGLHQPNETKPLFCCRAPEGGAAPWTVGGIAADYFFALSPTQQNDRGFVALGGGYAGECPAGRLRYAAPRAAKQLPNIKQRGAPRKRLTFYGKKTGEKPLRRNGFSPVCPVGDAAKGRSTSGKCGAKKAPQVKDLGGFWRLTDTPEGGAHMRPKPALPI